MNYMTLEITLSDLMIKEIDSNLINLKIISPEYFWLVFVF